MSVSKYLLWRWGANACRKSEALPALLPSSAQGHLQSLGKSLGKAEFGDSLESVFLNSSSNCFSPFPHKEQKFRDWLPGHRCTKCSVSWGERHGLTSWVGWNFQRMLLSNVYFIFLQDSYPNTENGMWYICEEIDLLQSLQGSVAESSVLYEPRDWMGAALSPKNSSASPSIYQ